MLAAGGKPEACATELAIALAAGNNGGAVDTMELAAGNNGFGGTFRDGGAAKLAWLKTLNAPGPGGTKPGGTGGKPIGGIPGGIPGGMPGRMNGLWPPGGNGGGGNRIENDIGGVGIAISDRGPDGGMVGGIRRPPPAPPPCSMDGVAGFSTGVAGGGMYSVP